MDIKIMNLSTNSVTYKSNLNNVKKYGFVFLSRTLENPKIFLVKG
jgi:hypothetical protein